MQRGVTVGGGGDDEKEEDRGGGGGDGEGGMEGGKGRSDTRGRGKGHSLFLIRRVSPRGDLSTQKVTCNNIKFNAKITQIFLCRIPKYYILIQ
jgi:hypothetical protein